MSHNTVSLKSDQGQQIWFANVKLNVGYYYAKFKQYCLKSLQERAHTKFLPNL